MMRNELRANRNSADSRAARQQFTARTDHVTAVMSALTDWLCICTEQCASTVRAQRVHRLY